MFARGLIRPLIFAVGSLVAGLLLLGAAALLVNLSWVDATLHPELERLKKVEPLLLEENAYPIALGFIAADGLDPRAAGEKILQALHERFLRGEPITLDTGEMSYFLGGTAKRDVWQTRFKSLDCNARVDLDCADRVIAEVTPLDTKDARLGVLLNRYESMIHEEHFVESQERTARLRCMLLQIVVLANPLARASGRTPLDAAPVHRARCAHYGGDTDDSSGYKLQMGRG